MHPARCRNQPTPPDTDESNSDNDMDIDSQHSILCTPQPLSTPQIYAPEFSPLEKYGYPPSLSGSSDDGSRDSMGGISEQNDEYFSTIYIKMTILHSIWRLQSMPQRQPHPNRLPAYVEDSLLTTTTWIKILDTRDSVRRPIH
jgi:hypothetical protein